MMEFAKCYPDLVRRAWDHGVRRTARGKPHRSLFNVMLETWAVENLPLGGGFKKKFAIAELMAYCCGWDDVAWLHRYNKNIGQFSDNGISFHGAYGPRISDSIGAILALLREDPDTRQAICQIYRPEDLMTETKDKPCNTMFQLQIIPNSNGNPELHMTVYQRSCDLVWGLPYDHFSFSTLCLMFAAELGIPSASVVRHIGNAHVYEPEAQYADLDRVQKAMEPLETMCWFPPNPKFFSFRESALIARYELEGREPRLDAVEYTPEARYLVETLK